MQFEIQRVSHNIEPEEFERRFYRSRTPVVVQGVATQWPASRTWTPDKLRSYFQSEDSQQSNWWWDVADDFRVQDYQTPAILDHLRGTCDLRFRKRPTRVWISSSRTRSGWHYDGNSLDILNVQVRGKKRFTLVSPDTPLECFAFDSFVRRQYDGVEILGRDHDYTTFDLEAGDMLFLPRFWFHMVDSLGEINVNLNWVWTDLDTGAAPSLTASRERECVALRLRVRRFIDWLRRRQSKYGLAMYGSSKGFEVAERFCRETPVHRLIARGIIELSAIPPGWFARRRQQRLEVHLHDGVSRAADDYFQRRQPDVYRATAR